MTQAKQLKIAAAVLVAAAVVLRLVFFWISVSLVQPTADESIAQLMAEQVMRGDFPVLFLGQPYLFPVESYIAAPLAPLLPNNAFGARIVPALLQAAAVFVAFLILARMFRDCPPRLAGLLLLFPSAYLLMMQAAYALPGYSGLLLLSALAILVAMLPRRGVGHPGLMAALAGLFAGLSFASHMLAIPFMVGVAIYVCLGTNWRTAWRNTLWFAPALFVGLLPYLVAKWCIPGAHAAVTQQHGLAEAWARLWSPAIKWTLNTGMGIRTTLFPDGSAINCDFLSPSLFGAIWAAIIVAVVLLRAVSFVRRAIRNRWPSLEVIDVFAGIAVITLASFIFGKRADSKSYRYLLPLVWSFPFLIAYIHHVTPKVLRIVPAAFILLLAGWNVAASGMLMRHWQAPGFAVEEAAAADLVPVLDRLKSAGIHHCVASYGTAYRINYQSGGNIIAGQPMNERFPGWPTPYKAEVDAASPVAYVLTDTVRFLKPSIFDRHLRTMGIASDRETCGDYVIYSDFKGITAGPGEQPVMAADISLEASHNPADLGKLTDGDVYNRWSTQAYQEDGMWLRVTLAEPVVLSRLRVGYGAYFHDHAPEMAVIVTTPSESTETVAGITGQLDKFAFENGRPVYGGPARQTIALPEVEAKVVSLHITHPHPKRAWTLCELELLESTPDE
ncbi:MAG: discoidin domain-containing protein [Kiritimatiellae bacterium]|nr:discoidin domain-containing protein [Kiritimatiellia bacterium]